MIICREVVSSKYNKKKFEIFWVPWVRILLVPGLESFRELNPLED